MVEYDAIEELVGEMVVVTMTSGREYRGRLESYKDDFGLTLTGDGGDPNNAIGRDATLNHVDGTSTLNGENVESVSTDDRP